MKTITLSEAYKKYGTRIAGTNLTGPVPYVDVRARNGKLARAFIKLEKWTLPVP